MKKVKILFGSIIFVLAIMVINCSCANAQVFNASNVKQFRKIVYTQMLQRKETIDIDYSGKDYKAIFDKFEAEEFINELASIDDISTSDDHDYMIQNVSYMKTSMKGTSSSDVRFTIKIKWRETLGQLQYVNLRVADILQKHKVMSIDSVYQRIKLIHDYIVTNVEYDVTLKHENAYSALKEGVSTCQGYSLLFYKMLTDAGIPCRYITGTGINDKETGPHGWNIVKIGDLWYNVDTTWDDPIYSDPSYKKDDVSYEYFLKGSSNFDSSHIRDTNFLTPAFLTDYVVSEKDFNKLNDISISQMTLGSNSDITADTLKEEEEEEPNEIDSFVDTIKNSIRTFIGEIKDGTIKDHLVKSFKELDDKNKGIIISLLALVLITIVYKVYKSSVRKEDEFDTMFDDHKQVSSEIGGLDEMIAKDAAKKKAEQKAQKQAMKEAKRRANTNEPSQDSIGTQNVNVQGNSVDNKPSNNDKSNNIIEDDEFEIN